MYLLAANEKFSRYIHYMQFKKVNIIKRFVKWNHYCVCLHYIIFQIKTVRKKRACVYFWVLSGKKVSIPIVIYVLFNLSRFFNNYYIYIFAKEAKTYTRTYRYIISHSRLKRFRLIFRKYVYNIIYYTQVFVPR